MFMLKKLCLCLTPHKKHAIISLVCKTDCRRQQVQTRKTHKVACRGEQFIKHELLIPVVFLAAVFFRLAPAFALRGKRK
jgi:hypothetical protein